MLTKKIDWITYLVFVTETIKESLKYYGEYPFFKRDKIDWLWYNCFKTNKEELNFIKNNLI